MTKGCLACELRKSGRCNCSQAIVCSFEEYVNIPKEIAMQCTSAFGAGMGNLEGSCGALVGAGFVLGMHHKGDKRLSMMAMRRIMDKFIETNGSPICKKLKMSKNCDECIREVAKFLEDELVESSGSLTGD